MSDEHLDGVIEDMAGNISLQFAALALKHNLDGATATSVMIEATITVLMDAISAAAGLFGEDSARRLANQTVEIIQRRIGEAIADGLSADAEVGDDR